MRLSTDQHFQTTWWVHAYARDFELLDLWQYPIEAESAEDFEAFLEVHDLAEMVKETSLTVRALFAIRLAFGRLLRWDKEAGGKASVPFEKVYQDHRELVMRTENSTVTALMHLGWVELENGRYTAQLAVYASPKASLGRCYMALIAPFRHGMVYPALMRAGRRRWLRRAAHPIAANQL